MYRLAGRSHVGRGTSWKFIITQEIVVSILLNALGSPLGLSFAILEFNTAGQYADEAL
jgi:hypothetical protein